ncbi:MAG: nicotinate-nucleotide--dimethylbenzimidazole phosphoribosyltransferase [Coriobacteriia bacterium]|nr:nicotinate-nucleotide--dimethylbenzimidazole phosphoribosyltransferase [Coriobacteriia bacterium]
MLNLTELNDSIPELDRAAMEAAVDHWNNVAKPIGSLGLLEDLVVQIAGLQGTPQVCIDRRVALPMCADNGVVAEGVTQTGQEITTLVAGNMAKGISSVCVMGRVAGVDVVPTDVGMVQPAPDVRDRSVARGTQNMVNGPAMTREQALQAIQVGIDAAAWAADQGYKLIVSGEMGIGNTTTSSAVASVLLDQLVEQMTGVGAGLSSDGLKRKVAAIKKAIQVNQPNPDDALDVLAKVGGFDIAALAGLCIGGALRGVPVLLDGFISTVSALVAYRMCPKCISALIATHVSGEPAARTVLEALGLTPVIHAGMRLGEGTGAVCLIPMLDMALNMYNGASFEAIGMEAYEVSPR